MHVVYASATSMVTMPDGSQVRVMKGTHWPADDPVVITQPSLFSADARYGLNFTAVPEDYDEERVEQVTAAPGEKRNTRRG